MKSKEQKISHYIHHTGKQVRTKLAQDQEHGL